MNASIQINRSAMHQGAHPVTRKPPGTEKSLDSALVESTDSYSPAESASTYNGWRSKSGPDFKKSWEAYFSGPTGRFDFSGGLAAGTLKSKNLEEAIFQPGATEFLASIRGDEYPSITRLYRYRLLEFAVDQNSHSMAALRSWYGERKQTLSVIDVSKGKFVGTWVVSEDGRKEWNEG